MSRIMKIMLIVALALLLTACEKNPKIQALKSDMDILSNKYPAGYPSSRPVENKIVGRLKQGACIEVLSVGYEKDFKYYKVRSDGGDIGYIIHSGNVAECKDRGE